MTNSNPTHIFISCSVEDVALARWLARKLAAHGYPVWFDKIKSLGGEPWPHTAREAIKYRTFRMLAIVSERSLRKKRHTAERTLAHRIGQQRKIPDFLIPLSADGVELGRPFVAKAQISFANGWMDGWKGLIKKLDTIKTPRTLKNGPALAAAAFPHGNDLRNGSGERLLSNLIRIKSFPTVLRIFQSAENMDAEEWEALGKAWTFYEIAKDALVAFIPPPPEFSDRIRPTHEQLLWTGSGMFRNFRPRDIAASLILKALARRLVQSGCLKHPNAKLKETFFLPDIFADDGQIAFISVEGKKIRLPIHDKVAFRRAAGLTETNSHHFAFRLRLARGLDKPFYVQITPTLIFFNEDGEPILDDRAALSRLRRVIKTWDNDEWLKRVLAVEHIFSNSSPAGVNDPVLEHGLVTVNSPVALDESVLDSGKESEKAFMQELELEEPEMEGPDE